MARYNEDSENDSASSDDNDETMEDMEEGEGEDGDADQDENGDDEGDGDGDADGDGDGDGDVDMDADDDADGNEGDDDADEDDQDQPESPSPNGPVTNGTGSAPARSPSHPSSSTSFPYPIIRPKFRAEMMEAHSYDIVPTMAAPQSTSINAVCATPNMRWVFTGGSDGYIRKFNWIDTANGKLPLTVAQRHPFVDSVIKAGVLLSYWENEEMKSNLSTPTRGIDDAIPVSPVYSLAVHHQALWLLSGDETGAIGVQSVRHSEGSRITNLRKHTSAVSVLTLAPDERSVLSGGWDKQIYDWDLNIGQVKRSFSGNGGQISAIEARPQSSLPVPDDTLTAVAESDTFTSNNADKPTENGILLNGTADEPSVTGASYNDNDDDMDSLFGGDDSGPMGGLGDDEDDEFSRAIASGLQQTEEEAADANLLTETGPNIPPVDLTETNDTTEPSIIPDTQTQTETATTESPSKTSPPPTSEGTTQSNTIVPTQPSPHSDIPQIVVNGSSSQPDADTNLNSDASETVFLDASHDGSIRIWDRRQPNPIARLSPARGTPPWCMSACWSPDGNHIYAGRRNNTVDEYSLHGSLREPSRTFRFPSGSGPVSAVRAMPNGKSLVCASFDILRLYDLEAARPSKHTPVPFTIVPGHRTGVISQLYLDPTCTFLISTAGNRGWDGSSTEVLLGYEIGIMNA